MKSRRCIAGTVILRHEKSGADVELPADMVLDLFGERIMRSQAAMEQALRAYDEYPPEILNEDGDTWRVGGAARRAWSEAFKALREASS